jgi:hypothetical protein
LLVYFTLVVCHCFTKLSVAVVVNPIFERECSTLFI